MDDESFFSINRLVEFGMGVEIAQQMVKTMNESMTTMHIPGAMNQVQSPSPQFYYVIINGLQAGPFTEQDLASNSQRYIRLCASPSLLTTSRDVNS